jgi:hypothetical protein
MTVFGKPVDEAAMEEAFTGFMMWHLVIYGALASFAALLVAYGVLVYRYRKGLRAGGEQEPGDSARWPGRPSRDS